MVEFGCFIMIVKFRLIDSYNSVGETENTYTILVWNPLKTVKEIGG